MLKSIIISVSDKSRLEHLLEGIFKVNSSVEVFSTMGTANQIRKLGFPVKEISFYTGAPESPEGNVKTLHPKIHGGILLDKNRMSERKYLAKNNIKKFGLIVTNFYEFEKSISDGVSRSDIVEKIDIGGPTLARSAAKGALRHGEVAPLVKTSDYGPVVRELSNNDGKLTEEMMNHLAYEAFDSVCRYDVRIRKCIKDML